MPENINYVGIEPSTYLSDDANNSHKKENREFKLGNAYHTGLENE